MMFDELLKWLIGTIGVGTVTGLVVTGFEHLRRKRNAVVSVWAWYRMRDDARTLRVVVRNRSPFDLIVSRVQILETPYGHTGFANGADYIDVNEEVDPEPPFTETVPSGVYEWPMREEGMVPRSIKLKVTVWTADKSKADPFVEHTIEAMMS